MAGWERAALLVPLALHAWLLYLDLIAPDQPRFGFGQALSVMLWLGVAIYWVESLSTIWTACCRSCCRWRQSRCRCRRFSPA